MHHDIWRLVTERQVSKGVYCGAVSAIMSSWGNDIMSLDMVIANTAHPGSYQEKIRAELPGSLSLYIYIYMNK